MTNEQKQHIEQKVQFLRHAAINCHPSMKKYYHKELEKYHSILKK